MRKERTTLDGFRIEITFAFPTLVLPSSGSKGFSQKKASGFSTPNELLYRCEEN